MFTRPTPQIPPFSGPITITFIQGFFTNLEIAVDELELDDQGLKKVCMATMRKNKIARDFFKGLEDIQDIDDLDWGEFKKLVIETMPKEPKAEKDVIDILDRQYVRMNLL